MPGDGGTTKESGAAKTDDEFGEITGDISDVRWMDFPVFAVFAALFAFVALQFFTRYALNQSLGWTEEIARYFLIMAGFLGAAVCARKNSHIALEFIHRRLPPIFSRALSSGCAVVSALFFGYCGWLATELAARTSGQMVSVALPKAIVYYVVAAACLLTAFCFAATLRRAANAS